MPVPPMELSRVLDRSTFLQALPSTPTLLSEHLEYWMGHRLSQSHSQAFLAQLGGKGIYHEACIHMLIQWHKHGD